MTNGEAINWIINISADIGKAEHRDLWHYEQALLEIRDMLESAQPEQRWVSCSERLPEYGTQVLTIHKDGDYEVNHVIDEEDGEWFLNGVIAWMPLPEPARLEGE